MADKAVSLFAGLDKALLRSTKAEPAELNQQQLGDTAQAASIRPLEPTVPPSTAAKGVGIHARTRVSVPGRVQAMSPSDNTPRLVDSLYRVLQDKQHLASSTFRFRPQELEELDAVFADVAKASGRRVSKNDLVRIGLVWLLQEYKRGNTGVLAQVLRRL